MKKIVLSLLLVLGVISAFSQNNDAVLNEQVNTLEGKMTALDERVLVNESDLSKLNKIKFSGYIQSQYDVYSAEGYKTGEASNSFYMRRVRLKATYEATDGVKFVLQPDFSTGNLSLKDAYAVLSLPKFKDLSLWAGQFNRPNYEVQYSSSQREVLERSRVIRALYPGEREIGAKLEYISSKIPLKLQLAALNGNFTGTQAKDVDSKKDIMARATYSLKFPNAGMGLDFGVNGYFGNSQTLKNDINKNNNYVINSDLSLDSISSGGFLKKQWFGAEAQLYLDILGGLSLKGEYISGQLPTIGAIDKDIVKWTGGTAVVTPGTNNGGTITSVNTTAAATITTTVNPSKIRNFSGYYVYLIKNLGLKNQLVGKYDFYDPNTKLSGDEVKSSSDLSFSTVTIAWQHYLNDNIRISLQYEMPKNENSANVKTDKLLNKNPNTPYDHNLADNTFSVRIQAKF
jgi:phosphate-selective porin